MGRSRLANALKEAKSSSQAPPALDQLNRRKRQHSTAKGSNGSISDIEKQFAVKKQKGHVTSRHDALQHVHDGATDEGQHTGAATAEDPAQVYQKLINMLSQSRGKASEALRHRQKQEQGDSDVESDDAETENQDDEEGSEKDMSQEDGLNGDILQAQIAAMEKELQEMEGNQQASIKEGSDGEAGSDHDASNDSDSDKEDGKLQNGSTGIAGVGKQPRTRRRADKQHARAQHDIPVQQSSQQQQQQQQQQVPDTWLQHVEHQLTDTEAAELSMGGKVKWTTTLKVQQGDGESYWQSAGNAQLPDTFPTILGCYSVKERLVTRWREVHAEETDNQPTNKSEPQHASTATDSQTVATKRPGSQQETASSSIPCPNGEDFSCQEQAQFFSALQTYSDITVGCRAYPHSLKATDPILDAYLVHCLNHIAKTSDKIKKNNERLEAARTASNDNTEPIDVARDQGFTRPKVLILLPQRNLAFQLVLRLVKLAIRETRADSVTGKARFVEQFTDPDDVDEAQLDAGAAARRAVKPPEWRALLGSGNLDDHFRLGIKITRGAVRLFSNLLDSDIIVASPLALATKLEEDARRRQEQRIAAAANKKAAAKIKAEGSQGDEASDFLSSIEVFIIDRADMIMMQNWSHVERVVEAMNQLPREQHGVDIMRVREWALSGWAKHYRQTVLLSSFLSPCMNSLMCGSLAVNYRGKLRWQTTPKGVLQYVVPQVQQVFERFTTKSPADMAEDRFKFFTNVVWPRLRQSAAWTAGGLLLFVPSYFDFVRLRNYLKSEDEDAFETLSEYTAGPDTTAARNRFYQKRVKMLLYTERAHFYKRYKIRGIRDIMFYGPPEHANYYSEIVNLLESGSAPGSAHGTVGLLYCKWDMLALERLVGVTRAAKMMKGESNTYMFC